LIVDYSMPSASLDPGVLAILAIVIIVVVVVLGVTMLRLRRRKGPEKQAPTTSQPSSPPQ